MGVLLTGSKYYDSTSAIQVIGCILNNPHLLDEDGIYDFRAEDFNNEFHKVIFGSVYNLYNMGAEKLNTKVIEDYLSEKEHSFATYKANHGAEWLHQVYEQADILNFNYYYSRLKKMTLLRAYDNIGLDVSWIYDPDNIIDLEKKQEQSKLLDNTPIEEIADMIDNRVLHIREYLVDGDMDESCQIGDDAEKLLEELKQNPAIGYPLYDKVSSDIAMGARTGKFYLRSAATGVGKAIPNDTLIPTPNGWRKVGDIKVGDYLFAQDSSPTKVLAVFPQPTTKEIWKVTFADGRVAECCGEHLWEYFENGKKRVEDTQTIYKRIKKQKALKNNFSVRVNSPYGNYIFTKSFVNSLLDIESKCISFSRSRKERTAIFDKEFFCLKEVTLLRGLGIIPQVTHMKNSFYRVSYSENDFSLLEKFLNGEEVIAPTKYLKIVDIKKTSQKTDMTCFTVDNKDHLFLMNDFIVTHNTRNAMADACYMSCSSIYENGEWVDIGEKIPTIFISVELDKSELQTMAWSFVSGVPENHILENKYDFGEYERVVKAIQILKESKLFIEYLPDYNMKDIENCIKRNIRVNKCSCVFLDYITSSMKIIEEITRASGGMKIREDQILFLLSSKLKDIAGKYGVFIYSSTQLNNSFKQEKILDQGMLAGAKSIANRIDYGSIMVDMVPDDYEDLAGLLESHPELGVPNIKLSIYKNRRGKINRVICWQRADKGTSRYKTLFVTDYNLNLIDVYEDGKVV
jgi:SPBc2 prophage-derived uncharacterized protein yorI